MAVTVTDQRTIISECDATTGWTGSNTVTLFTTKPTGIETTGCLGMVVSNATHNAYFTVTSVDLSGGHLIYVWIFHRAALDTTANGGIMIQLGDGTNRIGFHVAGSDVDGFRHSNGPVGWQCVVLDTANLPTARTVFAGSFANLNLTTITQIGVGFKTLVKSVGGVANCFWDILRRGSAGQGLVITGGTIGDPGTFEEIAEADRQTGNQQAYGIVRKLGEGVFGVQGSLTFGDSTGTSSTYFADQNVTVVFEERGLYSDKYVLTITGNATGDTTFILGTKTGTGDTTSGVDGCIIQAPNTTPARFIATNANIDECSLYGSQLIGFKEGVSLSNDATTGINHEYAATTFRNCGIVDVGRTFVRNCSFVSTAQFDQDLYIALQDDGGVFTNYTTAANNDTINGVFITPASPAVNDAFYIGHYAQFNEVRVLVSQAGTGVYAVEFWNGSTWTAVSGLSDTTSGFSKISRGKITYTLPGTWATTTVNSLGPYYYLRFRVTTAGTQARATRFYLVGPAEGAALLWNENIDINNCDFNNNTGVNDPAGIEHPSSVGSPYVYNALTFSGNDFDIYNTSGNSITVQATNGSNPTTYKGSTVTIENTVSFTLTGLQTGSEVRIYEYDLGRTGIELAGIENSGTSFTYNYNYTGDIQIIVVIFSLGYRDIWLGGDGSLELLSTAQSIPIQQQIDRNYANP